MTVGPRHPSRPIDACSVPLWAPSATLSHLKSRARIVGQVRSFLDGRGYWEVDTPILSRESCVDAHLDPIELTFDAGSADRVGAPRTAHRWFLQTSAEFGMKRLLSAGSGSIYQVSKVFRAGEAGRLHNPEFTMVEWYRVGGSYSDLMTEVGDLATFVLGCPPARRMTYREAFHSAMDLDPFSASIEELARRGGEAGFVVDGTGLDRDELLNVLFAHRVQPTLGRGVPTFIVDFPATQSALARIRPGAVSVAERFELFVEAIELCNGYQELTDADELLARNHAANAIRQRNGKPAIPVDSHLLEAMRAGLPECAGVALGLDRLVMLALGEPSLRSAIAFPIDRA